jgi:protein-tyrosine phosphatase
VLVVCTGNVCRSPYIAAELQRALPDLSVASAGTSALVGKIPGELVLRALEARGPLDRELVAARRISKAMVRRAALIVTATRAHRAAVVALDRSAADRAFTLKELARVMASAGTGLGVTGVAARAAEAARTEAFDHDDDLADPYGLEWPAYETMAAEVDAALAVLVPALREGDRADRHAADG